MRRFVAPVAGLVLAASLLASCSSARAVPSEPALVAAAGAGTGAAGLPSGPGGRP